MDGERCPAVLRSSRQRSPALSCTYQRLAEAGEGDKLGKYEVVLGPAAKRFILSASQHTRDALAGCLRDELQDGPNAAAIYKFTLNNCAYLALPLSHSGIVAIYRPLTDDELRLIRRETRGSRVARSGYYLVDFLLPTSAIYLRGPTLS